MACVGCRAYGAQPTGSCCVNVSCLTRETSDADEFDATRRARNEVLLRRYNEHVEAERMVLARQEVSEWVCECADERCALPVKLSIAEYEAVRIEPTHFLVAPSDEHVAPEIEYVVRREPRYWVIAKVGVGAEISRNEQEPRRM